jgi:hypothetical protein
MATEQKKETGMQTVEREGVSTQTKSALPVIYDPKCQVPATSSEGKDGSSSIPYQQKPINHNELIRQAKEDYDKSIPDLRAIVRNHLYSFMISKLDPDETPIESKTDVEQIMRLNMELFNHTNVQKAISGLEKTTKKNYSVLFHIYARCAQRILNGFVGLNSQTLSDLMKDFSNTFDKFIPLAEFEKIVAEAKRQVVPFEVAKDMIKGWFSSGADSKTAPYAQGLAKLVKFILPQRYHYYTIYNQNPQEIEDFKDVIRVFEKDLERDDGSFDTMVSNLVDVIQMSSVDENMLNTTIKRLNRLFNEFGYNMSIKKGGAPKQDCLTDQNCKNMTYNIFKKEGNCVNTRVFNFLTDTAFGLTDDDYTRVAAKVGAIDCKHPGPPVQGTPTTIADEVPIKPPTPPTPTPTPTPPGPTPTPTPPAPTPPGPIPGSTSDLEKFLIEQMNRAADYAVHLNVKLPSGDQFTTQLYTNLDDVMNLILQMLSAAKTEKVPSIQKLLETLSNDMQEIATQIFTNPNIYQTQPGSQQVPVQIVNQLTPELQTSLAETGNVLESNLVTVPNKVEELIVYNIVVDMIRDSLLVLNQYILTILLSKNLNSDEQNNLLSSLKTSFSETVNQLKNLIAALKGNDPDLKPKMNELMTNLSTIVDNLDKPPSAPPAIEGQGGGADEPAKPEPIRMTADTIKNDADAIRELRKKIDSVRGSFKDIERAWSSYESNAPIKNFTTGTTARVDDKINKAIVEISKELKKEKIYVLEEEDKTSSEVDIEKDNAFNTFISNTRPTGTYTNGQTKYVHINNIYICYNYVKIDSSLEDSINRRKKDAFSRNRENFVSYLSVLKNYYDREGDISKNTLISRIVKLIENFKEEPAKNITDLKNFVGIIDDNQDDNTEKIKRLKNDINGNIRYIDTGYEILEFYVDKYFNIDNTDTDSNNYTKFKKTIYAVINIIKLRTLINSILPTVNISMDVYQPKEVEVLNTYLSASEPPTKKLTDTIIKNAMTESKELVSNILDYSRKYAALNPVVKQRVLEVLDPSDDSKSKINIEGVLKQLETLIDSDFKELKNKIAQEKQYLAKGGAPDIKEDLLKNRQTIKDLIKTGNDQLNLLDAMVQDFTGTLKKSVGMPGYYSNVMMNPGGFSLFDTLYKKYIESQNDTRKGPYVANMELAEGLKSNKLVPREVLAVSKQDKIIFIAFTFFIRLIALAIVDYLINKERINKLSVALIAYLGMYIGFFLVFLLIVNIDGYKLRIVLNYFNLHGNMSVAFAHPMLVGIFGTIMYLVMKNMNTIGSVTAYSNEDKVRLKYKMQVLTLVAWVFVSIITMFT